MILRLPEAKEAASLIYLSWLAYPATNEAQRRDAFIKACAFYLHRSTGVAPRHMPPGIAAMKPSRVETTINSAWSRIVHRRVASVYAWIRLLEQRRDEGSVTAAGDVEVDVNGAASIAEAGGMWATFMEKRLDLALETDGADDAARRRHIEKQLTPRSISDERGSGFRSRTWRPTQPIMPMAVAFCFSRESITALTDRLTGEGNIGDVRMDGPISLGLTNCITSPGWVREAVSVAQLMADQRDNDILFPVF